MRTSLKIALGLALLCTAMFTGGCLVPRSRLDAAQASNAQAQRQLNQIRESVRSLQDDNESYRQSLKARDKELASKNRQIRKLQQQLDELKQNFDKLSAMYESDLQSAKTPVLGGPLPAQVDEALREFAAANPDLMEYIPEYGMVKMKSDLTFALGSAEVQSDAEDALQRLAEILNDSAAEDLNMYVAGHTDDAPVERASTKRKHPNNWYLSAHRAIGVQDVLTDAGIDPDRLAVVGFGEFQPVAPNRPNKKGNEKNRRVEIWIVTDDRFMGTELGEETRSDTSAAEKGNSLRSQPQK